MNKQLDCEIVRDLLPSYLDGQTSDVTGRAVENHISQCPECAEILRRMREPEKDSSSQQEEIDYLKKVKRSKRESVWITAALTLLALIIASALFVFVRGTEADLNEQAVNIRVDGSEVYVDGFLTSSGEGTVRVTFEDKDGVVDIKLYTAPVTPFSSGSISAAYTAESGPVKAVTSGGLVLWENGVTISRTAAKLYALKNPYIGDMPADLAIANAIGITERYGTFHNELQTEEETYGWVIILSDPVDPAKEAKVRDNMLSDACLLIAAVDNLDTVVWRYENGSGQQEYTITKEEASETAGADIKSFAESASGMHELAETVR